jgi:LysR family hydrogen peroxide-inducible transcriptional activator
MLPTLRQLQFFDSLARNASFSRAADECSVSQSTLSAGIKELETILDAPLVDRTSRQFQLTPLGEDVSRRAIDLLNRAHDMVRLAAAKPPLSGDLRLGLIPTIGPFLLPLVMPSMGENFPSLRLFLREELTDQLVDGLLAGRLDMAVLAMPVETKGLDTLIFAEDPFVFACAPDHELAGAEAVTTSDLAAQRLLLLEDGHCLRDHALAACQLRDRESAATFGATSLLTLAQMVRSGLGTTLLPQLAVDQGLAAAAGLVTRPVVDRDGNRPSRDLGLAWRFGSGREDEARALAAFMAPLLAPRDGG